MAKLALCIGINDYPGTVNDLSGCVNDAQDWSAALEARGFTVRQLIDKAATKKAMQGEMERLVKDAKSGDVAVIQYSGHGSYVPDVDGDESDGTDEVLCPYDIGKGNPLTDDELNDMFMQRAAGARIILVSDSCHSGSVSRFAAPPRGTGDQQVTKVRFLPPATFLSEDELRPLGMRRASRVASPPGRQSGALLVAGCQDTELSYDAWFSNRANGAFTFSALRALKKINGTGTYRQWYKAIRESLPSQQYPQTPNLFGTRTQKGWKVFQ